MFGKVGYHFTVSYKITDCSTVLLICSFRICILVHGSVLSSLKLNPGTLWIKLKSSNGNGKLWFSSGLMHPIQDDKEH